MVMKLVEAPAEVVIGYGGIVSGNPGDGRARVRVYADGTSIPVILYDTSDDEVERVTLDYEDRKFPITAFAELCRRWAGERGPLFVEGVMSRAARRMLETGLAWEHTFKDTMP